MIKFIAEIIDLKITALYSFMIALFSTENIDHAYKIVIGLILVGYHLHRWYIMHDNHRNSKKDQKQWKKQ